MRIPRHDEVLSLQLDVTERLHAADVLVRETLNGLVEEGHILGAFPFGSAQVGDFSPLSDYDIVVEVADFSTDEETVALRALHNAAKSVYRQTRVPLEVSCFTTAQYAEGMHELPTNMLDWLKKQRHAQPHNVLGKDFVPDIVPRDVFDSIFVAVDTFVASTRHLLKKNWLQGVYFKPHDLLGLTLDAPHILGRKMAADADDVRRASVRQFVSQNFSKQVVELFEDIRIEAGRPLSCYAACMKNLGNLRILD